MRIATSVEVGREGLFSLIRRSRVDAHGLRFSLCIGSMISPLCALGSRAQLVSQCQDSRTSNLYGTESTSSSSRGRTASPAQARITYQSVSVCLANSTTKTFRAPCGDAVPSASPLSDKDAADFS